MRSEFGSRVHEFEKFGYRTIYGDPFYCCARRDRVRPGTGLAQAKLLFIGLLVTVTGGDRTKESATVHHSLVVRL